VVFAFDLLFEPTPGGKVTIPSEGTALNPCVDS